MATILLNGVAYDAANVTDDKDLLTFRGGSSDALNVNLAGGDDRYVVDAEGEDITNATMRGGEGDDVITAIAGDPGDDTVSDGFGDDFVNPANIGGSLIGGPGEDTITVGDGLAVLTGTIKGNEDADTINLANANGGFVQGNSGDDTINLGFAAGREAPHAGSRADASLTNSSINGSAGDDTINVDAGVSLTDSTLRGNEGDDTITADAATASGAVEVQGNAGDDTIDASAITGAVTIRGGKGNDTLIAGNGQTVFGGLGADTFEVAASGGVFIEDFDKLDLPDNDPGNDDDDCFCDDRINVRNINFDTHTYDVERVKYTSASSWTGDIKVKAVAEVGANATAKAELTATKTATISAFAVARLFITKTDTANTETAESVKFDATDLGVAKGFGITKTGETFINGLGITANNQAVTINGLPAVRGRGIGAGYAQATGYWNEAESQPENGRKLTGTFKNIIAQTYNEFDKGDFSFLQLTATDKAGIATNAKLVYNQVTNATIKNHWASYNKVKQTGTANLFTMDFGTRHFDLTTVGKAYMVVTKGIEDKAYKTETITGVQDGVTAKVTLTLDNTFEAWHKVKEGAANVDTTTTTNLGGKNFWDSLTGIKGQEGVFVGNGVKSGLYLSVAEAIRDGYKAATVTQNVAKSVIATKATDNAPLTTYEGRFVTAGGKIVFNDNNPNVVLGKATSPRELTSKQLYWTTVQRQNLATVTTTVRNTALAGLDANGKTTGALNEGHNQTNTLARVVGVNNTNVTEDDFVTATAELVMKIKVSDSQTKKVAQADGTIVRRTTIFGQDLGITSCPDFPTVPATGTTQGLNAIGNRLVDGQAKHGDVVGDFNNVYMWNVIRTNQIGTTNGVPNITNANDLANVLNDGRGAARNTGFFSAATFTVDALAAQGFGANAVRQISATQNLTNSSQVNAKSVPFRVLFFDNEATSNGLHIISGEANYAGGELTAVNIGDPEAGTTSSFGGKHTIVKVTGGKGSVIELADINFI